MWLFIAKSCWDKCSSYTEETDLDNFKIFVNSISNVENNWLTVTAKQPEILETYLNLKTWQRTYQIDCETLKYENVIIELFHLFSNLFHYKADQVLKIKNQCKKQSYSKLLVRSKNE